MTDKLADFNKKNNGQILCLDLNYSRPRKCCEYVFPWIMAIAPQSPEFPICSMIRVSSTMRDEIGGQLIPVSIAFGQIVANLFHGATGLTDRW